MQRLPDKNTRKGRERGEGGVIPQQRVDLGYIHTPLRTNIYFEYFFQRGRWALYAGVVPLGAPGSVALCVPRNVQRATS